MTESPPTQDSRDDPDARKPSMRVIDRVAAAEGVDPSEFDALLYEVIDPSSLDQLFEDPDGADCSVTFPYAGYEVTVGPDRTVHLD